MSSDKGGTKRRRFSLGVPFAGHGKKNRLKSFGYGINRGSKELSTFGQSLRSAIAKAVIPQDLKVCEKIIFDPQDRSLLFWNRLLVISCIIGLYIDPLFFYLLVFDQYCLKLDSGLAVTITFLRTAIDCVYFIRMVFQLHTAYIAPSSRVFGRGELVVDPALIARRYLRHYFIVDVFSVLPIPQIMVFVLLRQEVGKAMSQKRALLALIVIQYFPRVARFFPIISDLKKTAGAFAESAVAGAAYYLVWYLLCSHTLGALWYVLAVERNGNCWQQACEESGPRCNIDFLYCGNEDMEGYHEWKRIREDVLYKKCNTDRFHSVYNFGIYTQAITSEIHTSKETFWHRFMYCLWFGLQNLSAIGQGLKTSTFTIEILLSIAIGIIGLILLALLIGNLQTYLQSLTVRLEEMRIKRRDSEQWMHHRWLPQDLRERVRRYDHFKWLETRGVDEESLVQSLPKDLRRDIKRHLCLNLVRRVPLFANMDEQLLDAICERLKPSLCTRGTCVVREGDPVDEMLLIIRGSLESVTTDGGRTGFFNRGLLKEGDFCGEELLTWALEPKSMSNWPSSTRTVRALTEVEAFALKAEELKFVASQFRRLHSRQVQHTFRFYSQQWRTWAACFIQATYRRRKTRKEAAEQRLRDEARFGYSREIDQGAFFDEQVTAESADAPSRLRATVLASRFAANLRGQRRRSSIATSPPRRLINLQKPTEPDFSEE